MKKIAINFSTSLLVYLIILGCDSKPKVIEGTPIVAGESNISQNHTMDIPSGNHDNLDGHLVVVNEVLNTEKYSYLNVTEDADKYWIAIPRKEVQPGKTYFYKGGLLKKNFKSKEYNRVFEKIYLVSDVISHPSNGTETDVSETVDNNKTTDENISVVPAKGSIKLAKLFADPDKYNGKLILVTGKCVKVNPNIMGRNWVHIQDDSGKDLDLTITTMENVNINAIVSFEGTIALNKDFGAGYKYDVIMEEASLK